MDATATLLQNGQVLIAGGRPKLEVPGSPVLASAELFDPATGKFSLTGSMTRARYYATATLLADGRVLIAGGRGCSKMPQCRGDSSVPDNEILASAELYDPATGRFTPTGSMSVQRQSANAVLLTDGRVLMLNGGTDLAEVYDPATGKFSRNGSLPDAYTYVRVALLPSGKVLVVYDTAIGAPGLLLYDAATGTASGPMPLGSRRGAPDTVTSLKNGRVLITVDSYGEVYDPIAGTIDESGPLVASPASWFDATATLLPDGRVLIAGGNLQYPDGTGTAATSAGLYDPATGFHAGGSMRQGRWHFMAVALSDGRALLAGGLGDNEDQIAFSSAELFVP